MNKTNENYIDHEVRIRIQEENSIALKKGMKELSTEVKHHFTWTLGVMIALMGGMIIAILFK